MLCGLRVRPVKTVKVESFATVMGPRKVDEEAWDWVSQMELEDGDTNIARQRETSLANRGQEGKSQSFWTDMIMRLRSSNTYALFQIMVQRKSHQQLLRQERWLQPSLLASIALQLQKPAPLKQLRLRVGGRFGPIIRHRRRYFFNQLGNRMLTY